MDATLSVPIPEPPSISHELFFLTTSHFSINNDAILNLIDDGEIPSTSNAKVLKINSTLKLLSFIEGVNVDDFPYLIVFVLYDKVDEKTDAEIKQKLEEKFADRSIFLEVKDESNEIFIKEENKSFEGDKKIARFVEMLNDDQTIPEVLINDVLDSKNMLLLNLLNIFDHNKDQSFLIYEGLIRNSKKSKTFFDVLNIRFEINGHIVSEECKKFIAHHTDGGSSILKTVLELRSEELILFILNNFKEEFDGWSLEYKQELSKIAYNYPEELKEIFPLMIQSNFPYPDSYDEQKFASCLNSTLRDQRELHEAFDRSDQDVIALIDEVYRAPHRKLYSTVCYNTNNEPLLKRAFERPNKHFYLYALLKCRGFTDDPFHQTIKNSLKNLSEAEVAEINNQTLSIALPHDRQYGKILASKSKVHDRGNYNAELHREHSRQIDLIFDELGTVPEMANILRVVADAELIVQIHFDFSQTHTHEIIVNSEETYGIVYPDGKIIIGAGNFEIAVRTLAHELTHLAMSVVYGNLFKPFKWNDTTAYDFYVKAIEECHRNFERDNVSNLIVPVVFTHYRNPDKSKEFYNFLVETIVRAPEMIVNFRNDPEGLQDCRTLYPLLFEYFETRTLPELQDFDAKPYQLIKNLNKSFGKLSKSFIKLTNGRIILNDSKIIATNAPKVAVAEIRQKFGLTVEREVLFVGGKILLNQPKFNEEYLKQLKNSKVRIVLDASKLKVDEIKKVISTLNVNDNQQIFIIIELSQDLKSFDLYEFFNRNLEEVRVNYFWDDLNNRTKQRILLRNFDFQGENIPFANIIRFFSKIPSSDKFLTLMVDKKSNLTVNKFENVKNFHLEREFSKRTFMEQITEEVFEKMRQEMGNKIYEKNKGDPDGVKYEYEMINIAKGEDCSTDSTGDDEKPQKIRKVTKDQLVQKIRVQSLKEHQIIVDSSKFILISSDAGTGKSQSLKVIRQHLKASYNLVQLIELNKVVNELKTISLKDEDEISFKTFFLEKFLAKSSEFERIIFEYFYNQKKIFILFDGFDEISPICKDQVIKLMKAFDAKNDSQLWVTTRSHLEQELCRELELKSLYTIRPFNDKKQITFLARYWENQRVNCENLKDQAEKLVKRIGEGNKNKLDLLRDPQVLTLFADACVVNGKVDEEFIENFTKHSIYQKHVAKQIENWTRGKIGFEMNAKVQVKGSNFIDIHKFLALQSYCEDVEKKFDFYRDEAWTDEEVNRCGIVAIIDGVPIFKHESFKEYFVADFILENLTKSGKYLKEALKLLVKFLKRSEQYHVINMFISGGLKTVSKKKLSDSKIEKIAVALEEVISAEVIRFLTNAMLQNYLTLYGFLLQVFRKMSPAARFNQLSMELIITEEVSKIKIPNNLHQIRIDNYREKMKSLIENEDFSTEEQSNLSEMLEELMRNLRTISPIGRSISNLLEMLRNLP